MNYRIDAAKRCCPVGVVAEATYYDLFGSFRKSRDVSPHGASDARCASLEVIARDGDSDEPRSSGDE